jgi:hypothetical protein
MVWDLHSTMAGEGRRMLDLYLYNPWTWGIAILAICAICLGRNLIWVALMAAIIVGAIAIVGGIWQVSPLAAVLVALFMMRNSN